MNVEHGEPTGRPGDSMDIPAKAMELEIEEKEYRSLLQLFTTNAASELAQLEEAIGACDFSRIAELAHSLKGASASLGLAELLSAAQALESSAQSRTLTEVPALRSLLREELERISTLLAVGSG